MADKLSVSDIVTKVYEAARDGSSDLTDLLKRLKTEQRKTALETKTKDSGHFVTPLIVAAHNGHLNSVKILLGYGADIEARGTLKIGDHGVEGCTPLWAAAFTGFLDVVKLLIERNADVDSRTPTGSTPLRAAAHEGHLDVVRCLVESGADVNARSVEESTPLMVACFWGHLNTVTYLINKGAFIDLQYIDGRTALHAAVQWGYFEIVTELLALGASQLPNNQGLTDTEKAFSYLKRGMEERYEDPARPLLKKKMEPVEAYQNRKESQTLEELALLEGDDHAIGMEGLIIRERILGPDNPVLGDPIRYRGGVLADSGKYELCIGLWKRAMEKAFNCDDPITKVTVDVVIFASLFGEMVKESKLLRANVVEDVFEILVAASEKRTEQLKSGKLQDALKNKEQERTLYGALYLLMIILQTKSSKSQHD